MGFVDPQVAHDGGVDVPDECGQAIGVGRADPAEGGMPQPAPGRIEVVAGDQLHVVERLEALGDQGPQLPPHARDENSHHQSS